jgi:flavin reductase (DIM6/NTAB) family NADH-FMN oxidoreductase RutF
MTLSSFSSLSLFPEPVVTFNIRSPSRTLNALSRCRQFLIHILDVSPEGARIADLFTKGNRIKERMDHSPFSEGVRSGDFRVVSEPGVVGPEREEVALPRLQGAGVRRVLKCEILKGITGPGGHPIKDTLGELHAPKGMIRVGDHILVLAKVLEILDCNEQDSEGQGGYGLSYVDGKYRHVGEPISLRVEDTKATMHKPRR